MKAFEYQLFQKVSDKTIMDSTIDFAVFLRRIASVKIDVPLFFEHDIV